MVASEMATILSKRMEIDPQKAMDLVKFFFKQIEQALVSDERVEIRGFGVFKTRYYNSYDGRNPKTGKNIVVKAKRLPRFKAGLDFYRSINDN